MSECVRTDVLLKSDGFGQFFDEMEDHDTGYVLPSFADEYEVFIACLYGSLVSVDKIEFQLPDGSG